MQPCSGEGCHVTPAAVLPPAGSGKVQPRPNVLRLMDEARGEGLKVAVASAGTKEAVTLVVETLLGADRYEVRDPT